MKLSVNFSNSTRQKRALLTAIATGSILMFTGCGIPQLRRAKPAASLPQSYEVSNNWNHGPTVTMGQDALSASHDENSVDSDGVVASDQAITESNRPVKPVSFASFIQDATARDVNEAEMAKDPAIKTPDVNSSEAKSSDVAGGSSGVVEDPNDAVTEFDFGLSGTAMGVSSLESSAQLGWHQFFDDPFLTNLIDQALVGNQELRILAEEIRIAGNEVQSRSGEYLPFLGFGAGAGAEKPGLFTRNGAVEEQLEIRPGQSFPEPLPDFLVAANLTWEIDIWRKLRNAKDAACLRYLATNDGRNYVVTRMVAEVAENYYELLALDNRLVTLDKTIEIQQKSLETSEKMKAGARGTELAVQRFQAEVRKNQSEKLIIQQQIVEAENRINFLLGRYPQPVERMSSEYIELNLHTLSLGVPSQLLRNRSDVRQAERELAAAGLDVKVAKARFYPSLVLTAGVGYRAFDPKYLFSTPESLIYSLAGDLVAPLINKRAIRADYLSANSAQLQAVYNYQRTVLNAYTEVINYMSKVENYRQSIEVKKQQLASLEASVDSATKLFQNARAEYVEVLLAQRDMMEAKMVLIETKQQQLTAVVNAYQALGGGSGM